MELPNAKAAHVPLRKLTAYLLSETHAVGKAKASFFWMVGFSKDRAEKLREALIEVAQTGKVERIVETPYGKKYTVDGEMRTPSGRRLGIRTVWIMESGQVRPRFVTAYPHEGE